MIRLALPPNGQTSDAIQRSERQAHAAGLTGAEIDAARQGRSFDVQASAAIALALAMSSRDPSRIARERLQALTSGLTDADIEAVEQEALRVLSGSWAP